MAHARTTIRQAAVSALTGLTTTGANVTDSRVYTVDPDSMPHLSVYTLEEERIDDRATLDDNQMRRIALTVEVRAKQTSTVAALIDTIDNEVSTALYADGLGVKAIEWMSITVELSAAEEQPIALGTIMFDLFYHVDAASPGAAIP